MKNMIARGYADARTLLCRIAKMEEWLKNPSLMSGDENAEYADSITIKDSVYENFFKRESIRDITKINQYFWLFMGWEGVPKSDIVLAFHDPETRKYTEFAIA